MAAMFNVSLRSSLLGLLVIAAVTLPAYASRKSVILGGKSDVGHVRTNMEIQELGRYCVEQFNLQQQNEQGNIGSISQSDTAILTPLNFSRVVSAQKQVVAGTKYYLRIQVTQPDGSKRMVDSVLVIQPWLHSRQLIGFTPVTSPIY